MHARVQSEMQRRSNTKVVNSLGSQASIGSSRESPVSILSSRV